MNKVVIGSGFGDEGKGLFTDYFASQLKKDVNQDDMVITKRFNGGAQAGHTVNTPCGKRHVFNQIGSGYFAGTHSHYGNQFLINPAVFGKEYSRLLNLGFCPANLDPRRKPRFKASPNCRVTTPYDMIMNQKIESHRGNNRHGSCGYGIHETMVRHNDIPFYAKDLKHSSDQNSHMRNLISSICDYYEAKISGMDFVNPILIEFIKSGNIFKKFIEDIDSFLHKVNISTSILYDSEYHKVYEGSQGLLLDQDHRFFPHVTHSKTGIHNVANELNNDFTDTEVVYVTRCYATRHGNGPMRFECKPYDNIYDNTNKTNEWQGKLRYGYLDLDLLVESINNDRPEDAEISIGITCLDQIPDPKNVKVILNDRIVTVDLIETIKEMIKPNNIYTSYGPTRDTITKL